MTTQEMINWYRAIEFKERGELTLNDQDIATLMIMYHNQEVERIFNEGADQPK